MCNKNCTFSQNLPLTKPDHRCIYSRRYTDIRCPVIAVSSFWLIHNVGASHPLTWRRKQIQFPKRCVLYNNGRRTKPQNPVIPSVIYHRQNSLESRVLIYYISCSVNMNGKGSLHVTINDIILSILNDPVKLLFRSMATVTFKQNCMSLLTSWITTVVYTV
jgi:hypothetical protein